jgi:FtsP/CotA-like multicopper oxidase with cupredoxin domain
VYLPAEADGGPHQPIAAGKTWRAEFTVDQPAASLWCHPHLVGTTEQVYRGLAGFMLIDDNVGPSSLPSEYGVDDLPLVLQERRFDKEGTFRYEPRMPDIIHGYGGNVLLINGGIEPVPVDSLVLSPGERAEVVLDVQGRQGEDTVLQAETSFAVIIRPFSQNRREIAKQRPGALPACFSVSAPRSRGCGKAYFCDVDHGSRREPYY